MGLFEFLKMLFGPKNSGSIYGRFVDLLLQKIQSPNVVAYTDDVLIFTKKLEQHVQKLRSVLELHRMDGITLRPNKTKPFQNKMKYLVFDISAEEIEI